jgi:Cft2 family RNA processing exonuclease
MRVRAISGYGVKGPAAFLLELNGPRFLLDCGRGPDGDAVPDLSDIGRIDAVLVSHAHRDHTGALHLLESIGNPPIYATELTGLLAGFTPRHVLPLGGSVDLGGIEVLTGRAGHAPGGVWLRIGGAGGLLYTGDFSHEGGLFAADPWPKARAMIFDASYGVYNDDVSQGRALTEQAAQDGPLLLPTPAAGRGLEMAVDLSRFGHAVRLCPVHRAVAALVIQNGPGLSPTARNALTDLLANTEELASDSDPHGVMIAAKADASGGLAAELVAAWSSRDDVQIVFTGHLSKGTPAASLVGTGRARFIRWNVHPRLRDIKALLAAVEPERAMPAFLPSQDLAELAAALPDIPLVLSSDFELSSDC